MEVSYDKESFLERAYRRGKSESSKRNAKYALAKFDNFCLEKFGRSIDEVLNQIMLNHVDVYKVLDAFVGYMDSTGIDAGTISTYMTWVRNYMVYCDIEISEYKFRQKVSMPKRLTKRDAELTHEQAARISQIIPLKLRMLCMLMITTLRRPNEILQFRVRDFDFDSKPAMIRVPASLSKNRVEGETFTSSECAGIVKDHIRKNHLKFDDYLFGTVAASKYRVTIMEHEFWYHLRKYPELCSLIEGTKRHKIHLYSFKKYGYTIVDRYGGKNFADGLKGDKKSEYHRMPLQQRKDTYLSIEHHLTIFNADEVKKEIDAKYSDLQREVEELRNIITASRGTAFMPFNIPTDASPEQLIKAKGKHDAFMEMLASHKPEEDDNRIMIPWSVDNNNHVYVMQKDGKLKFVGLI